MRFPADIHSPALMGWRGGSPFGGPGGRPKTNSYPRPRARAPELRLEVDGDPSKTCHRTPVQYQQSSSHLRIASPLCSTMSSTTPPAVLIVSRPALWHSVKRLTSAYYQVGAGPTGLILAATLAMNGVSVRLVERESAPRRGSKGSGIMVSVSCRSLRPPVDSMVLAALTRSVPLPRPARRDLRRSPPNTARTTA
jgi:hypothetical protein